MAKKQKLKSKSVAAVIMVILVVAAYGEIKDHKDDLLPDSGARGVIESANTSEGSKQYEESNQSGDLTLNEAVNDVYGPYNVEYVIDGDTYMRDIEGKGGTTVRLIGVDTPESVAKGAKASANCEEGKEASNFMKDLLDGQQVYLEYDVAPEDRYGRVLAYVYLNGTQIQKTLLEKGYARTMTIAPNVQYADEYSSLQKIAQDNSKGFWETNPWEN